MKRSVFIGIAVAVSGIMLNATPEVKDGKRVYAPIRHEKYFQRERELFGYNPQFQPGTVSFDNDNVPYIISNGEKDPIIQTLDKNGKWIKLDIGKSIKKKFPAWNGYINLTPFGNRRISFDAAGDAYFMAATGRSNLHRMLLLYSRDKCRTWQIYPMPYLEFGRLEVNDTFNLKKYPPVILFYNIRNRPKGELAAIFPTKKADGSLDIPKPMVIVKDSATCPPHSGDGNFCVSVGDKVHFIWTTWKSKTGKGNSHYARTYNRLTGKLSPVSYVGNSNEYIDKADNHCLPVITVDGKGYLHAILGTHHHQPKYVRSLKPDSTEKWTAGEEFGIPKRKTREGSYTYHSINCDKDGNIHTIARWAGYGYRFALVYNKRTPDGKWAKQQILVMPFRAMYGCWYHKVSIDKKGRLFVYYINYLNQFDKKTLEEYNKRWPEDKVNLNPAKNGAWDKNIQNRDPAVLMSEDGGKKWFLATTPDFVAGCAQK
jgi:hypothetical protein